MLTEAWVLSAGPAQGKPVRGELRRTRIGLPEPADDDVLVAPLIGCWEANMSHALGRDPIDVCQHRGEDQVILGNSGVVRVLRPGPAAADLAEGTLCLLLPFGQVDAQGYALTAFGYDARGTIGLLARRTYIPARCLLPLPAVTRHPLTRWAATARYFTAWDNWHVAFNCWRAQQSHTAADGSALVFGWGGGVALAECELAQRYEMTAAITSAGSARRGLIAQLGITPVDRGQFPALEYDPEHAGADPDYAREQRASEKLFLETVRKLSDNQGVAIFLDHLGGGLYRAVLKSLARQGVIASCGWKRGMRLWHLRASECIGRHLHVNTHVWRIHDSPRIRDYMEETEWLPPVRPEDPVWDFDDIPDLAAKYSAGQVDSYFPLYRVSPE